MRADELANWAKVTDTPSDNPSLIPGTHMMKNKSNPVCFDTPPNTSHTKYINECNLKM